VNHAIKKYYANSQNVLKDITSPKKQTHRTWLLSTHEILNTPNTRISRHVNAFNSHARNNCIGVIDSYSVAPSPSKYYTLLVIIVASLQNQAPSTRHDDYEEDYGIVRQVGGAVLGVAGKVLWAGISGVKSIVGLSDTDDEDDDDDGDCGGGGGGTNDDTSDDDSTTENVMVPKDMVACSITLIDQVVKHVINNIPDDPAVLALQASARRESFVNYLRNLGRTSEATASNGGFNSFLSRISEPSSRLIATILTLLGRAYLSEDAKFIHLGPLPESLPLSEVLPLFIPDSLVVLYELEDLCAFCTKKITQNETKKYKVLQEAKTLKDSKRTQSTQFKHCREYLKMYNKNIDEARAHRLNFTAMQNTLRNQVDNAEIFRLTTDARDIIRRHNDEIGGVDAVNDLMDDTRIEMDKAGEIDAALAGMNINGSEVDEEDDAALLRELEESKGGAEGGGAGGAEGGGSGNSSFELELPVAPTTALPAYPATTTPPPAAAAKKSEKNRALVSCPE
jgi:hypothetical protein